MGSLDYSELAQKLKPYIVGWLSQTVSGSLSSSAGSALSTHALNGPYHSGVLAQAQAPWALSQAAADARYLLSSREIIAGAGLSGGGPLTLDVQLDVGAGAGISVDTDSVSLASTVAGAGLTYTTGVLAVGAGAGLTVNADNVALTTPGTLTVSSTNTSTGSHTHAVTSSSNPGSSVSLLASASDGSLTLTTLTATTKLRSPLIDTASGALTLQPATDVLFNPTSTLVKASSNVALQASNFASQTTGWRITWDGQIDARYLFVDEMHAKSFITDLEQALAGGQIISKSVAMLAAAFTVPAANTTVTNGLRVRDLPSAPGMAVFQSGDTIRLRTFARSAGSLTIGDCWGVVTSYTNMGDGTQTWTFSRSASPNAGGMAAGTVILPDAIVLDYGTDGNGFAETNAIDGANAVNSPYTQFVRWTGHPATGQAVRTRLGNLRGIFGQDEFGLFAGTGTANTDRYVRISDYAAGNGINNLPFSLRNAGVEVVRLGGWNDVWVGPSSADKRLAWNGTTLTLVGNLKVQQDANNYVEINQSLNKLRGVGAGVEQWYASAADGGLYFGAGTGLLNAVGMLLYRRADASSPSIGFMVGSSITGGVFYYPSGGYDTVRISTSTDPGRIVLAAYNPGDANNPPASITIQQNAYVPLVAIKGVVSINTAKLTSDSVFALRNTADSAYQSLNLLNLGLLGGKILSDSEIQIRNNADSANQGMRAKYLYSVDSIWYSTAMHQFRDASSGNYNTMRSKAHYIESSTDPGAGSSAIGLWWDGTNLRATLPGGTTKTFTWT